VPCFCHVFYRQPKLFSSLPFLTIQARAHSVARGTGTSSRFRFLKKIVQSTVELRVLVWAGPPFEL
jgi:hypothetical protein